MHSSYEHIRSAVVACEFEDYHSCKVSLRRALQLLESVKTSHNIASDAIAEQFRLYCLSINLSETDYIAIGNFIEWIRIKKESENLLNKYVVEATNIFGHSTVFDIRDIESIVKVGGYPVMEICFRSGNVIKIQCSVTLLEDWTKLKNT